MAWIEQQNTLLCWDSFLQVIPPSTMYLLLSSVAFEKYRSRGQVDSVNLTTEPYYFCEHSIFTSSSV